MMFTIGQTVKTSKTVKPSRYARKTGTVITLNDDANEVGVRFEDGGNTVWFRPSELSS